MRDNLHRKQSLGEFANSVNLSVWRLCHIFKSETGMSPIQYLRLLKMERARYLLQTSFISVREITCNVGLPVESHFARDFKKRFGATPTLYRTRFHLNESASAFESAANSANKQQERPMNMT